MEALLATDARAGPEPASRMSLICARCVSELAVSGAGATTDTTDRWPAFTPEARALGAAAVFFFPIQNGVIRLGSLDCYRDFPGELGQDAITDALLLADLAAQTIMTELDGHATEDLSWLADPHAEAHQATGMVQVQLGVATKAELLRLRAHAYSHEFSLADVARQVVNRQLRFHPDDPPP